MLELLLEFYYITIFLLNNYYMTTILLLIIYLIFISLGLPDSLVGTTWPSISQSLGVPEDYQGILTCVISLCTIISSFFSPYLIKKLKPSGTVAISIVLTVIGLIALSFVPSFWFMLLAAIPLGLGGGAIDATLNNYVALHYKAIHMNWLHSFWGVGTTISPLIISSFLTDNDGWRKGAIILAIIQAAICIISLVCIPLWKKCENIFALREKNSETTVEDTEVVELGYKKTFALKGVWFALFGFLAYTAVESLAGMWFSSMVHFGLNVSEQDATLWASFFYLGITIGRFISGIISLKVKEKNMIRIGESIIFVGIILLFMTFEPKIMPFAVVLIGLGCAPVYPAIIKDTPNRFTKKYSQNVMGIQMSFAYISNFLIAPLFGVVAKYTTFLILPYCVLFFFIILVLGNEGINLLGKKNKELKI